MVSKHNQATTTTTRTTISNSPRLKTLKLKKELDVHVSEEVWNQISYLCGKISTVEWSGILFYELEGDISKPDKTIITLKHILPMHKGTGGSTEYEFGEEYVEFRMNHPEGLNWLTGHIHSHNNMAAYFSGTDDSEIHDNSEHHNFYLSIVVNNRMEIVGKMGFRGKSESKLKYLCKTGEGDNKFEIPVNMDEEVLFTRDCKIHKPEQKSVSEDFAKRVAEVIKEAEPKTRTFPAYGRGGGKVAGYQYGQNNKNGNKKDKSKTKGTAERRRFGGWDGYDDAYSQVFDNPTFPGVNDDDDDIPPDPNNAADIEDFVISWLTLGMPEEADNELETAIYLLGEKLNQGQADFIIGLILSNARTMYYRYFTEINYEDMVNVFTESVDMIEEYVGDYDVEVQSILMPALIAFVDKLIEPAQKAIARKEENLKLAKKGVKK